MNIDEVLKKMEESSKKLREESRGEFYDEIIPELKKKAKKKGLEIKKEDKDCFKIFSSDDQKKCLKIWSSKTLKDIDNNYMGFGPENKMLFLKIEELIVEQDEEL